MRILAFILLLFTLFEPAPYSAYWMEYEASPYKIPFPSAAIMEGRVTPYMTKEEIALALTREERYIMAEQAWTTKGVVPLDLRPLPFAVRVASEICPSGYNTTNATACFYEAVRAANATDVLYIDNISDGVWDIAGQWETNVADEWFDGNLAGGLAPCTPGTTGCTADFELPSNFTIVFESGVTISAIGNTYDDTRDMLIRFEGVDGLNIVAYGATFYMRSDLFGRDAGTNHCLAFFDCSNISIEGGKYDGSGGDGIIFSTRAAADSQTIGFSENITVKNVWVTNQQRQGISPISAINMAVSNALIENTGAIYATPNRAGYGVEPDGVGFRIDVTANQMLVKNSSFSGLFHQFSFVNSSFVPAPIVNYNDVYVINSFIDIAVTPPLTSYAWHNAFSGSLCTSGNCPGTVTANRLLVKDSAGDGIGMYSHINHFDYNFTDIAIIDAATSTASTNAYHAFEVSRYSYGNSVAIGDIAINGYFVDEPKNQSWLTFDGGGTDTYSIIDFTASNGFTLTPYTGSYRKENANASLGAGSSITMNNQSSMPAITVSIGATASTASRGGTAGSFTITRNVVGAYPLPVEYTIGGSATNGDDFDMLHGYAIIPANQASLTVTVSARAKTDINETAVFTLVDNEYYSVGTASATINIGGAATGGIISGGATNGAQAKKARLIVN